MLASCPLSPYPLPSLSLVHGLLNPSFPPASDSYIALPFGPCPLLALGLLLLPSSLTLYSNPLLSWPVSLHWPCSVHCFLPLLWTSPDTLAVLAILSIVRTSSTTPRSGQVLTSYTKPWQTTERFGLEVFLSEACQERTYWVKASQA